MICVSIGNVSSDQARVNMPALGADLVELRLDLIEGADLKVLLGGERPPVIVTNRPEREGGKFTGSEEERLRVLEQAMELGAEYVDVEWDSVDKLKRSGETKIVVSRHDFEGTPSGIGRWLDDMGGTADIVKIVTSARDITDNFTIFDLLEKADVPTVAFCMGEAGAISRVLCPAYGSAWTYAAPGEEETTAPGQFTLEEMRDLYRVPSISRDTKIFGVIANPVGHSMSPLVHNSAFAKLGVDAVYLPLLVTGDAASFIRAFAERFPAGGFSITIPHKEAAVAAADDIDDAVRKAGALNTIAVRDGVLHGYNTDIPAAMAAIDSALPEAGLEGLSGVECLLMGAGGAGRAIAIGIKDRGAKITISDGIRERAERLAEELGARHVSWEDREDTGCDVIMNATPIGMHPNVDASPVSKRALERARLVFDAVYNPPITTLLRDAAEAGVPTTSGLDMFVNQAAMQFELWTQQSAPVELMREKIISRLV